MFQKREDASQFHLLLRNHLQGDHHILLKDYGHHISVLMDKQITGIIDACKIALFEFITKIKFNEWFKQILKEHYFFEDEDEQQQIIDIIRSILEGNRKDLENFFDEPPLFHEVERLVEEIFSEQHFFSFDSFVKFRLRPLFAILEKYVEISIDEYKMEQEYQVFIQTLRQFLENRQAKMDVLHLVIDDDVTFYNEELREISRSELVKLIDRKLLSNHPIYIDSVTIAPLLSIAPKKIYLYTNEMDAPLARTIQNIFEERVHVKRHLDFPFCS